MTDSQWDGVPGVVQDKNLQTCGFPLATFSLGTLKNDPLVLLNMSLALWYFESSTGTDHESGCSKMAYHQTVVVSWLEVFVFWMGGL